MPLSKKNPAIVADRKINITLNGHISPPSFKIERKRDQLTVEAEKIGGFS